MCVMELASLLAGETFSDRPRSVCPVIASLLRSYNDAVSWEQRQELLPYATAVLGTSASREVRNARVACVLDWLSRRAEARSGPTRWPAWASAALTSLRRTLSRPFAGRLAVRAIDQHTDVTHGEVLALVKELVEIGAPEAAHTDRGSERLHQGLRAALEAEDRLPRRLRRRSLRRAQGPPPKMKRTRGPAGAARPRVSDRGSRPAARRWSPGGPPDSPPAAPSRGARAPSCC